VIRHLSYVGCDSCGDPAQPSDGAIGARAIARGEGFARVRGRDLCGRCRPDVPHCCGVLAAWYPGPCVYVCHACGQVVRRRTADLTAPINPEDLR